MTMSDSVTRMADRTSSILLAPFARSNTDFEGLGERDVLRAIELARRDYKIDALASDMPPELSFSRR